MHIKRNALAALVLAAVVVAPLHAELKYTMRIQAHPSSDPAPAPAPANALLSAIGPMLVQTLAPAGGTEFTVTVGERGTRVDYPQAYTIVPAGGATLMRPDGSMVVLNPADKTYWRMGKPDLSAIMKGSGGPQVTVHWTGEYATVAGLRSQRAVVSVQVPLPVPAGMAMPAGVPAVMAISGDVWLTDQYRTYAKITAGLVGASGLGLEKLAADGFLTRSVLRGEVFGDQEIESVVTNVAEVTVPASTFDVPAGYTEVPPPSGSGMLGAHQN